jgi:hypothetical protein
MKFVEKGLIEVNARDVFGFIGIDESSEELSIFALFFGVVCMTEQ